MTRVLAFTDLRPREIDEPLSASGVDAAVVSVAPDGSLLARAWAQIRDGIRVARADSPDVVVAFNGSGILGAVAVAVGLWLSVPVLIRVNGDVARQHHERVAHHRRRREYRAAIAYVLQAAITRATFAAADGFLVVSAALADVIREQTGAPDSRIAVVHSPVPDVRSGEDGDDHEGGAGGNGDHDDADVDALDRPDGVERTLLTVTNLNFAGKREGVETVVGELWPHLPEDTEYVIAGDGVHRGDLETYIAETVADPAVRERIRTPGYVEDVGALYDRADAFVYVSHIDGYPNAVLEAQEAALPVLANAAHGMVEQVDHGETGLLVAPDWRGSVRNGVRWTLADPGLRRRLGEAARERVRTENDPARVGAAMADAIDGILGDIERDHRAAAGGSE